MEKTTKYFCELCNYGTNNRKDYTKHTLTRKHKRKIIALKQAQSLPSVNATEKQEKKTKLNYVSVSRGNNPRPTYICNNCNKQEKYSFFASENFWSAWQIYTKHRGHTSRATTQVLFRE